MTHPRAVAVRNLVFLIACLGSAALILALAGDHELARAWLLVVAALALLSAAPVRRLLRLPPRQAPGRDPEEARRRRSEMRHHLSLLGLSVVVGTFSVQSIREGAYLELHLFVIIGFAVLATIAFQRVLRMFPSESPPPHAERAPTSSGPEHSV